MSSRLRRCDLLSALGSAIIVRRSMSSRFFINLRLFIGLVLAGAAGCYYPAKIQPPPATKTQTLVKVPYDLTWDAVHSVVSQHDYKILGDDPDAGIIETQTRTFTLADADCGQMKSIATRFDAEPDPGGSAVYNFKVAPDGRQATHVSITATYTTPLHVPLHPITNFECVSRGTQEARLLREVTVAAELERRPTPSAEQLRPFAPNRPSLMGPDILKKPRTQTQ